MDKIYSITAKLAQLEDEVDNILKELSRAKLELRNQQEIVNILNEELKVARETYKIYKRDRDIMDAPDSETPFC